LSTEPLNTLPVQQFLQVVKNADLKNQKEIRLDIATAKNLAFTLGIIMSRLEGDLEKLLSNNKSSEPDVITVKLDSGSNW
jgi:selenophosphate synthase